MNKGGVIVGCIGLLFDVRAHAGPSRPMPAGTPDQDARAILIERDRRRPASEEYLGEVVVVSKDGRERRKTWRSYRAGTAGASDRLIRFLSPPEVRGVGYLAHFRRAKEPDEWLYLPSMKRERRIGARDREGAFVGTNFSYEDLDLLEYDDTRYEASLITTGPSPADATCVIQLKPIVPSGYSKKILTLRKDDLRLLTVTFFVAAEPTPIKQLSLEQYQLIDGYQIATRIEMTDLRKGGHTTISLREIALNRPQPRDRYTIQNLLREDGEPIVNGFRSRRGVHGAMTSQTAGSQASTSKDVHLPPGFSGYAEVRTFGLFGPLAAERSSSWATLLVRQTGRFHAARFTAAIRFEDNSASHVGPLRFDPADRERQRSPISIRELSIVMPIGAGLDVQAGRYLITWGDLDGYSPADAFLPRDFSDPLTEERLPLWAATLRGERKNVRFEIVAAPTTTPWRLPALDNQPAFTALRVTLVENPWTVPRGGFGAARITGRKGRWDLGAWARAGVRPAPVIDPHLEDVSSSSTVPIDRHFAQEQAAGVTMAREYGGWIVRGELGVFHSRDTALGNAAIWAIGGSRIIGQGTVTATVAMNAMRTPGSALFSFDRALLPCAIIAAREYQSWGSWSAAWLATFQTVGGVLSAEVARDLTDTVKLTVGADVPHGALLSPATAFSGGRRARLALRWSW